MAGLSVVVVVVVVVVEGVLDAMDDSVVDDSRLTVLGGVADDTSMVEERDRQLWSTNRDSTMDDELAETMVCLVPSLRVWMNGKYLIMVDGFEWSRGRKKRQRNEALVVGDSW